MHAQVFVELASRRHIADKMPPQHASDRMPDGREPMLRPEKGVAAMAGVLGGPALNTDILAAPIAVDERPVGVVSKKAGQGVPHARH